MSIGYNPYRQNSNSGSSVIETLNTNGQSFFNNRIAKLSLFGRNYQEAAIKNAKGIHKNEDLTSITDGNGYNYTLFSRKVHAMMQERQTIAAMDANYLAKLPILREYATKGDIRDFVTKMANEIVVYGKDKKFCELEDLPNTYDKVKSQKIKAIFENIYTMSGFADGSLAWDICRDWLVEGFICREIIYDKKGKNIIGFQQLDPLSIVPIIDPESGLKIWVQFPYDEVNRRIMLDAEIIYISYSGSSNYMETSYVEPLIRPYNELKSIERARLLFNLINATMHKEFIIPVHGLSPAQAEQEIATLIADYKDHIAFDDTTGQIFVDGNKDLPYSKEYWLPNNGEAKPEMNIIEPAGHDLNENSQLIWFNNALKRASKFPFTRLDNTSGGGNIYSIGGEVTHDDYNFDQYVERCRTLFKDIILKPLIIQILLDFPEEEKNNRFYNDLNITFYGHSELIKAKALVNMQAKAAIAADLTNNLKREDDKPVLHWKFLMKHIMEFTDEQMAENDKYWKEETGDIKAGESTGGGPNPGGGETTIAEPGTETGAETAETPIGEETPGAQTPESPETPESENPAPEGPTSPEDVG